MCPWDASRPFPKTHLPFPSSPRAIWGRRRGGQGREGACSNPLFLLTDVAVPARAAAPALASTAQPAFMFPAFTPRQPQDSPAPRHCAGQDHGSAGCTGGDPTPRGTAGSSEHHRVRQHRGRASQPQEEENLICSPGVPSPGLGDARQGDATICINPVRGRAQEQGLGLHQPPQPLCHNNLHQHSPDPAPAPPAFPTRDCGRWAPWGRLQTPAETREL